MPALIACWILFLVANSIKFNKDALIYIIKNYTYEAGVRKLKEKVFEIIRQINLDSINNKFWVYEWFIKLF